MCRTFRGLCVHLCVGRTGEPCKTAEPIEVPVGGADSCRPKEPYLGKGEHWRHLANTIERRCAVAVRPMSNYLGHLFC